MAIDSDTQLLLSCDDSDGSVVFVDTGVNGFTPIAVSGSAAISETQFKFLTGGSLWIPSSGSRIEVQDDVVWDFLTNNNQPFTFDFWAYFTNISAHRGFCGQYQASNRTWYMDWTTGGHLNFNGTKSFQNQSWSAVWTPTINTWHHIAFARDASDNRFIFADGVSLTLSSEQKSTAWSAGASGVMTVGYAQGSNRYFQGYIDEFRFSDVDRYASGTNFTPETEPYGDPYVPTIEVLTMDKWYVEPQIPRIKPIRTNPGWSVTPGMEVAVPIKMDKWSSIVNYPARQKKKGRGVTQNAFVEFNTPTQPTITLDKWLFQHPIPRKRFEKKIVRPSEFVYNFVDSWQVQNGNYTETGSYNFTITDTSVDSATFADSGNFGLTITAEHVEDFQFEDTGNFGLSISYPNSGNVSFNSGVPGFVTANVTIDGVNESDNITGTINVTREDNTAARFKCILELDQTLFPARKPAELINKVVSISFGASDMSGVVADAIPIFVGICKHVEFNDDIFSIIMSGYDYGGIHQTRGEFVSANVTDVSTGTTYASTATTISLGHSPVWGVVWNGNSSVVDGQDYFINTLNGEIIIPVSSRIIDFPGSFTYNYMNPFDTMKDIIQGVMDLKGWTLQEDNVTIADYSSKSEHPVLSLSNESTIDTCRKFLELSGAKVETNLFPDLRVYSEVQNVINTVNTHTVDESKIFENSLSYRIDFDNVINEQTTRTVQKINANVVVGSGSTIAEFSGSKQATDPRTVQQSVIWWNNFDLTIPYVVQEHRINKQGLNSISFASTGTFEAHIYPDTHFEEEITGASWSSFTDGDDLVIQLKHNIITLQGAGVQLWTIPAFTYTLTVTGSKINYGDGTIEDIKSVTAQRPIAGITETLAGDVYENPYAESAQHCANINDAILLEHGNTYTCQFEIPLFEGRALNIGDRINIEKDSLIRFVGIIKKLSYTINLTDGQNAIVVSAKGVGQGI